MKPSAKPNVMHQEFSSPQSRDASCRPQEMLALFEGSKASVAASAVREVAKSRAVMLKMESAHKILIKSVLRYDVG